MIEKENSLFIVATDKASSKTILGSVYLTWSILESDETMEV
jgi:hypothetical protein